MGSREIPFVLITFTVHLRHSSFPLLTVLFAHPRPRHHFRYRHSRSPPPHLAFSIRPSCFSIMFSSPSSSFPRIASHPMSVFSRIINFIRVYFARRRLGRVVMVTQPGHPDRPMFANWYDEERDGYFVGSVLHGGSQFVDSCQILKKQPTIEDLRRLGRR